MAYKNGVIVGPVSFTGGTASIGTDATDNAINVGTAASAGRTTTVGNTTGTSATNLNSGSGGITLTTGTNADITLSPDGTGTVSVTAAPIVPTTDRADSLGSTTNSWDNVYCDGVSFDDGTNVISTYSAPTTWTPVLTFGGGSTGLTYGTQVGYYTQIGKTLTFMLRIILTNKGSSSGSAGISGLTRTLINSQPQACSLRINAITFTGFLECYYDGSTIVIQQIADGVGTAGALQATNYSNTSDVMITGTVMLA